MEKILLMLQLQNQLNNATNGEEWVKGITKNNKTINWRRCIYMESAEMIDCFAWKHWKNIEAEPDWDNLKIEIVDVWHFIMSLAIEFSYQEMLGSVEDIALSVNDMESFSQIQTEDTNFAEPEEIMKKVEEIMRDVLSEEKLNTQKLFDDFFSLVLMGGLNLNTLYTLYIGKNILNTFRQDNGYKDGSYIKNWNGEEDNVYMQQILQDNPDIKPETLYKELTKIYHQVNGL